MLLKALILNLTYTATRLMIPLCYRCPISVCECLKVRHKNLWPVYLLALPYPPIHSSIVCVSSTLYKRDRTDDCQEKKGIKYWHADVFLHRGPVVNPFLPTGPKMATILSEKAKRLLSNDYYISSDVSRFPFCLTQIDSKYRSYSQPQSWALRYFLNFFNNTKWFLCIFYQVNKLFLQQSYLKSPLQVKLTW